ncbi:MAG: PhnD/SsuA/transferrin family substrate-binding protein, partial [Pseudomonadota bacterium]
MLLLAMVLSLLSLSLAAQELIMTAPPRESVDAGNKLYGPMAQYLGGLLGTKVVYKHPQNWLNYQRDMRNGVYDIVFDGPHFASWRMAHLGHKAVVKLPGTLEFYLLRRAEDTQYPGPDQLIGQKICGISPPNLSTLSVLAYYDNPVRQPVILGIKGGMG